MHALLVIFECHSPGNDYSGLIEMIQEYVHVKLASNAYIIDTRQSPKHVYDELRSHIVSGDTLFVFGLQKKWHGRGQLEVVNWVTSKL